MKILLIGKYPPMQGGISSKTYWLYKGLKKKGFEFKIVTFQDRKYSVQGLDNNSDIIALNEKEPPWHIPSTSLLADRLINFSFKTVEYFSPDIIEVNYLWPFCNVGLIISKMINKPFFIRHAGSDIHKFKYDIEFREIMSLYFNSAKVIATNVTSKQFTEEIAINPEKILCVPRYIPDPCIFRRGPTNTKKSYDILFAGKINYYWKRKGIMLLLEIIRKRKLKALFHIGGKYVNEVLDLISSKELDGYIKVNSYVPPDQMPQIYNSCRYVWCYEEEDTIDDFSNILWEAIFCGVPCIVNSNVFGKAEMTDIMLKFPHLVHQISSDKFNDFEFRNSESPLSDSKEVKLHLFNEYIKTNIGVYQEALKGSL